MKHPTLQLLLIASCALVFSQELSLVTEKDYDKAPKFAQTFAKFPKLEVELSKPLFPNKNSRDSVNWSDVFLYYEYNKKNIEKTLKCDLNTTLPIEIVSGSEYTVQKTDSNTYLYTFQLKNELPNFDKECLYINPRGPAGPDKITTTLLLGVVGGNPPEEQFIRNIGQIYGESANLVDNFGVPQWLGPSKKESCKGLTSVLQDFPYNCFSSVLLESNDPLDIKVTIFDHFGQPVWDNTTEFGRCGELNNKKVNQGEWGQYGWLAWPLKDNKGQFVKNGVYIWKIDIRDRNGKSWTQYHSQGVTNLSPNQQSACHVQQAQVGF